MHELLPQRETGVRPRAAGGLGRGGEERGSAILPGWPNWGPGGEAGLGLSRWGVGSFIGTLLNCFLLPQGMTRLLLTKIPFFREIIVSSFSCEHCGWNNTEIQSAGRIQDQGVRYTLTVRAQEVRGAQGSYPGVLGKAWGLESELQSRWSDLK